METETLRTNEGPEDVREILGQTLEAIRHLFQELPELSKTLAGKGAALPQDPAYGPFLDGIESFTEAMQVVKPALRLSSDPTIQMLEVDLTSILAELLDANIQGDYDYQEHLLGTQLQESFTDWQKTGLPLLEQRLEAITR
jgi:hypothetical protein